MKIIFLHGVQVKNINIKGDKMLSIRPLQEGDSHHLINIDSKCHEFYWDAKTWQSCQQYFNDWNIIIISIDNIPKGFYIAKFIVNYIKLLKFSYIKDASYILPIEDIIFANIETEAAKLNCEFIVTELPEFCCLGKNDPYDLSSLLIENGFSCDHTMKDQIREYGQLYDSYIFVKKLGDTNESQLSG